MNRGPHQVPSLRNSSAAFLDRTKSSPRSDLPSVRAVTMFGTLTSKGKAFSAATRINIMRMASETDRPMSPNLGRFPFYPLVNPGSYSRIGRHGKNSILPLSYNRHRAQNCCIGPVRRILPFTGFERILHRGCFPATWPPHRGIAAARFKLHQKIDRSYKS
jgi:hypothetical protein